MSEEQKAPEAAQQPPAQPVAWQYRHYHRDGDDGWGMWFECTATDAEKFRKAPSVQVRPLYAAPPAPAQPDNSAAIVRRWAEVARRFGAVKPSAAERILYDLGLHDSDPSEPFELIIDKAIAAAQAWLEGRND